MKKALLFFAFALASFAQCTQYGLNPFTGTFGCVAGASAGNTKVSNVTGIVVTGSQACIIVHNLGLVSPYIPLTKFTDASGVVVPTENAYTANAITVTSNAGDTLNMVASGYGTGAGINGAGSCCSISPSSAGPYTVGQAASQTFTASGCPSSTWSVSGVTGSGLSMNASTGVLSGTAAGSGGSPYAAVISYGGATQNVSITINAAPTITACGSGSVSGGAATCNAGTSGVSYSENVTSTGGTGTITYAITSGGSSLTALGLTMASTGAITGSSPTVGTASFTVVATDSNSIASSGVAMTLVVSAPSGFTFTGFATSGSCASSPCTTTAENLGTGSTGNVQVVFFSGDALTSAAVVTSSVGGNTWATNSCGSSYGGGAYRMCVTYCVNCGASASQTVTVTQSGVSALSVQIASASGASGSSAYDSTFGTVWGENNGSGVQTVCPIGGGVCPGSGTTPTNPKEFVVTGFGAPSGGLFSSLTNNGTTALWSTPSTGTASLVSYSSGNNPTAAISQWVQGSSAALVIPLWTGSVAGSNYYLAGVLAFKP